jgi:predicted GTPase
MHDDNNRVILKDLYKLIGEGHKRIGEQQGDKAILILGETGAGKSTLTSLFKGIPLKAKQSDLGMFVIEAQQQKNQAEGVEIGHSMVSKTKIPAKIESNKGSLTVWDCPGFGDQGREQIQDIANAFYIQRLFDTNKELKFILAVPDYHM